MSIQAHGGFVLPHEGVYYWYGENKDGPTKPGGCGARVDVIGISCYSSRDLARWKDEGLVLPAGDGDLHPSMVVERPRVLFNERTRRFVMWMHIDDIDYSLARVGVAVSSSPVGPFLYRGSFRPNGQMSRDLTLFKDDDGSAYAIYSSEENRTAHVARLSDDFLQPTSQWKRIFVDREMEAHAVFRRGSRYYYIASGCTGWAPNAARSAVADSIWGPWRELGNPCRGPGSEITFGGQSTCVFRRGDDYILMLDRWNKADLGRSTYLWVPLRFEGASVIAELPAEGSNSEFLFEPIEGRRKSR